MKIYEYTQDPAVFFIYICLVHGLVSTPTWLSRVIPIRNIK